MLLAQVPFVHSKLLLQATPVPLVVLLQTAGVAVVSQK